MDCPLEPKPAGPLPLGKPGAPGALGLEFGRSEPTPGRETVGSSRIGRPSWALTRSASESLLGPGSSLLGLYLPL